MYLVKMYEICPSNDGRSLLLSLSQFSKRKEYIGKMASARLNEFFRNPCSQFIEPCLLISMTEWVEFRYPSSNTFLRFFENHLIPSFPNIL